MVQLPYRERRKRTDNAETPFGNLKSEHEKWMKNEWKTETHKKQTRQLFLTNRVFQVVFHVVSLLIFDSIFQKNEMRNEMKNKSKTVTVNDTNVLPLIVSNNGATGVDAAHSRFNPRLHREWSSGSGKLSKVVLKSSVTGKMWDMGYSLHAELMDLD